MPEQRRFQRVAVSLLGRYMLESRREFPCQAVEMSPGDMQLFAPVKAQIGEKVIVYLDELGRFAGLATRQTPTGFSIEMNLSAAKRDKLADQLTWLANRHAVALTDVRRHERVVPIRQRVLVKFPDGTEHIIKIKDVSISGVALETDVQPALGSNIIVGRTPATIVRHFAGGVAGEFMTPFEPGQIHESMRL
jgi:hypothetical protein